MISALFRATPLGWFAVLLTLLLCIVPASAQLTPTYASAAEIPVSEFFRLPSYSQMAMSPDRKKLAALAPVNGRENPVVIDLETRKSTATTTFSTVDVNGFSWVDNGRLIFRVLLTALHRATMPRATRSCSRPRPPTQVLITSTTRRNADWTVWPRRANGCCPR